MLSGRYLIICPSQSDCNQLWVTWEGCGRNGIQCKMFGWCVGFSCAHLCGCCKQLMVVLWEARVLATNQRPLKIQNWQVLFLVPAHMGCPGHRAVKLLS